MKTITRRLLGSAAVCLVVPAAGQTLDLGYRAENLTAHLTQDPDPQEAGRRIAAAAVSSESDTIRTRSRRVIEEIVVSAQRRQERLEDVPISIAVLGGAELDSSTAQGMSEVLSRVPGVVTSSNSQTGNTLLSVRGVTAASAFNAGSSPVGYYLDSVPFGFVRMAAIPDPDFYDLNRVEVLRGPQGTLYGAGSQNGVVRVLTNEADLDEFSLKARTALSHTEFGGDNVRADAAVNFPLVEGKLATRAVLGYKDLSGWIDRPGNEDANDTRVISGRVKLNAQPTERFSAGLSAWVSRSDTGAPSVSANNRTYPSAYEPASQDFEVYDLKLRYDFPLVSITNTTSYVDFLSVGVADVSALGIGLNFINTTSLPARTFTNEVSLQSLQNGPWRWTVGGIFRDGEDRLSQVFSAFFPAPQLVKFTSESWAIFGELTRSFADGKLELTAGLRHFEDDVTMQEESRTVAVQPSPYIRTERKFDATTPRAVLNWHPWEHSTIYLAYAEGFRSGFDQLPSVLAVAPSLGPVEPDLLKNYELGMKGTLWGGRVHYDAAAFFMDWTDVQLPLGVIVDGVTRSAAVNGASASGIGADFALTTRPIEGMELGLTFGWNDLQVDKDVFSGTALLFEKGDRLNGSAEYTVGVLADYVFALGGSGFEGRLSASANLTSSLTTVGLAGTTRVFNEGDRMGVGRASFSIASPHRWTATMYVDNLGNEEGAVTHGILPLQDTRIRPRTYGIQLDYRL